MSLPIPSIKNIQLFADGADKESMLSLAKNPHVKGFTTNPSLMHKAGVRDYRAFCKELLQAIPDKPISFEVFADDLPEMKRQALEIAAFGKNVYVKIPVTNSVGESTTTLIRELSHQQVKLNVTAVFTLEQTWDICLALKGGAPSIISIFAGRIADAGYDPVPLMQAALSMCQQTDPNIALLWASSREVFNIIQADQIGCHIITVTPDLIKKTLSFGKDLRAFSLETVQMFKKDATSAGFTL